MPRMLFRALPSAIALAACATAAVSAPPSPAAGRAPRAVLTAALAAMGGEARLRAIRGVHYETVGSWASVESSDRPAAPWHRGFDRTQEWLDYERAAWRKDGEYLSLDPEGAGAWSSFRVVAAGGAAAITFDGKTQPGGPVYLGDAAEQLLFQPYRLLLAAADASDLRAAGREALAGQDHEILAFRSSGQPVRLWIDARTHRLTAAEVVHTLPEDFFWRVRGDVTDRLEFMRWVLHSSGVWFARQYDLTRNAIPYHSFVITRLEPNAAAPDAFAIPDDIRAEYHSMPRGPAAAPAPGERPVVELAPGVWFAAARRNALFIGQPGGALLIDAPISETYVARELDEVERRFGAPASAVVLTDHITPTLAGLREAAARGVAIHALDASAGFVADLLAAPHTLAPDALARSGRRPTVHPITARTVLGDGASRVELIPMRTPLCEREVLAWLPGPRLLWVANALPVGRDGRASPSRLAELDAVVAREHLDVDRVVGTLLGPAGWAAMHAVPAEASSAH